MMIWLWGVIIWLMAVLQATAVPAQLVGMALVAELAVRRPFDYAQGKLVVWLAAAGGVIVELLGGGGKTWGVTALILVGLTGMAGWYQREVGQPRWWNWLVIAMLMSLVLRWWQGESGGLLGVVGDGVIWLGMWGGMTLVTEWLAPEREIRLA